MAHATSAVPIEALATLRRRLAALSPRHPERRRLMEATAQLYAISRATLYRLLRYNRRPKEAYRSDRAVRGPCRPMRSSGCAPSWRR
jgi:hypothetical protein